MNKKIAESLGMEIPDDDPNADRLEEVKALTAVKPHEVVIVDNPDLPALSDIEQKLAEGEKQLEEVIVNGLAQMKKMFDNAEDASPDKVARYLEVAQMMMAQTLSAITHKNKLQLDKKKARLAEHSYKPENKASNGGGGNVTNNLFVGSREEALALIESGQIDVGS